MTVPDGTVVLDAVVTVPRARPALAINVVAAPWVWPTRFGAATCGGPDETTIDTALLTATCVPAAGFWLITDPAGTVVLDAVVTVPSVSPAPAIADVAAACVWPTTFGVATCGRPDETTIDTALLIATCVPAAGVWLITDPAGTVVLDAVVIVPGNRQPLPARCRTVRRAERHEQFAGSRGVERRRHDGALSVDEDGRVDRQCRARTRRDD